MSAKGPDLFPAAHSFGLATLSGQNAMVIGKSLDYYSDLIFYCFMQSPTIGSPEPSGSRGRKASSQRAVRVEFIVIGTATSRAGRLPPLSVSAIQGCDRDVC
jgi:hypothetical protein